ncbi:hypothetical protein BURMUCGD2M_6627 [Burkholderia multivorans CGD2M]|uniref:Uncharacterized protein n=1 Tax=Burkholderia multivorans CGD2 TaxID=513052 RepID=B9BPL3_9BURK|nr:hypothetical protein BURMUCGD2_6635 [Burkholderia multivorans CGD2]EEE13904.1 hypothetical protein BURMUCGD2M_6627 [Burkholderia multivorans CGD2M]
MNSDADSVLLGQQCPERGGRVLGRHLCSFAASHCYRSTIAVRRRASQ